MNGSLVAGKPDTDMGPAAADQAVPKSPDTPCGLVGTPEYWWPKFMGKPASLGQHP